MPLKFKHDLIRKRLKQAGQFKRLRAWEAMVKSKRLLYRAINMEPIDAEIRDLPTFEAKVKKMEEIDRQLDKMLFEI